MLQWHISGTRRRLEAGDHRGQLHDCADEVGAGLEQAGTNAIPGNLTLAAGTAVTLAQSEQIPDGATVTVSGASFNAPSGTASETIAALNVTAGTFNTGTGTTEVTGAATISGGRAGFASNP